MRRMFELKMKRKLVDVGEYKEEVLYLEFTVDGEVVDVYESDCIENLLIESSRMLSRNCERYGCDCRMDNFGVDINYKFYEE